jgi:hypothetical protein
MAVWQAVDEDEVPVPQPATVPQVRGALVRMYKTGVTELMLDEIADIETLLPLLRSVSYDVEKARAGLHILASRPGHVLQPSPSLLQAATALSCNSQELLAYLKTMETTLATLRRNYGVEPVSPAGEVRRG